MIINSPNIIGVATGSLFGTASFSQNTANPNYKIVSASYTLLETDSIIEVISGSVTQSLFTAVGYPGKNITIINASTGSIMILANGSETIGNLFSGNSTSMSVYSQDAPTMVSNNSNWRLI